MLRRIAVRAGVVHVHMNIAAYPVRAVTLWHSNLPQLNSYFINLAVFDVNLLLREFVFEALHHTDRHGASGNLNRRCTIALEVVGFERPLTAIKAVVRLHPCISGCIGTTIRSRDKNACRCAVSVFIHHTEMNRAEGRKEVSLFRNQLSLLSARYSLDP